MFPELSGGSLPFGVIFRTASADASEEEIRQEYLELSEKLARIVQYGTMRSLYSLSVSGVRCRAGARPSGMHRQFQNL